MRHLLLFVLVSGAFAAEPITRPSEADLLECIRVIAVAETKADGLRRLILLAGHQLLQPGSYVLVSDDPVTDDIQRRANRLAQANRDPTVVRHLMIDPDSRVRLWAVYACVPTHGQQEPWLPLIPLLKQTAATDTDAGVRAVAVERLLAYDQLEYVRALAPKESSPWVLMEIMGFSSGDAGRARWYQRAIAELRSDDAATRGEWLSNICGNVWNPCTAPMWRITADPELLAALVRIADGPNPEDAALAAKSVLLLRKPQTSASDQTGSQ